MLQKGLICAKNGLKMREVSKNWCRTMDEFYSEPNAIKYGLRPLHFPTVTIKVPLDEARVKRLEEFAEYKDCQFVGGRLTLLMSKTDEPVQSPIEDDTFQSICKRATDMTIGSGDYNEDVDKMLDLCRPFLRHMVNVKSISSNLEVGNECIILCLPNLEKLEYIRTDNYFNYNANGFDCANWVKVFQGCQSNLKFFECTMFTLGLQYALLVSEVPMESLMDLRATEHWWAMVEHDEDEKRTENGRSFIMHLNLPQLKVRFPKLTHIAVPFFSGYSKDGVGGDWDFPRLLRMASNNIQTLEEIEINVQVYDDISGRKYPIHRSNLGKGSSTVRQLVVTFIYFERKPNTDAIQWCFALAPIWPSLRFLKIQKRHFSFDFPSVQYQYEKHGDDWLLKCTKCC